MTEEELKNYKEQLDRLKKDFHKDDIKNIEYNNLRENSPKKNTPSDEQPKLEKKINPVIRIPEIKKISEPVVQKKENKKIDLIESITKSLNSDEEVDIKKILQPIIRLNLIEKQKKIEALQSEKIVKRIIPETEKTVLEEIKAFPFENIVQNTDPKIDIKTSSKSKESAIKEKVIEEIVIPKEKEIIPEINEKDFFVEDELEDIEEKKSNKSLFLKILIPILILVGIGVFIFQKISNDKITKEAQIKIEQARVDSVLQFEEQLLKNELYKDSIAFYENELLLESKTVLISDTIYKIHTINETGYYVIIGSFSEKSIAQELYNNHNSSFLSFLFEESRYRVALKISNDELQVFNDLQLIRMDYPDAWLAYNENY